MTAQQYIKQNGPTLTSGIKVFFEEEGLSKDAIRKRMSRVSKPIVRYSGIFKDNQALYYLQDQYLTKEYFEGLRTAIHIAAKRYYSFIIAIEFHNGYIKKDHFASYTYSPVGNLISHKNFKSATDELLALKILVVDEEYYQLNPLISIRPNNNLKYYKSIELAKEIVISQFHKFMRNTGFISYESATLHSEFFKFQFNFVASSYVTGITNYDPIMEKIHPAFVVADILLGNKIGIEEVNFFIEKVKVIKLKSTTKFLPFLILTNVEQEAFTALKQNGIIVGFVNELFGSQYEELIKTLINIVTNAGAVLKTKPDEYLKLIEQLRKLVDGKINNIRGDLFELAVGYYYSNLCQSLDISKEIIFDGQKKEIDVYANFQEKIICAECKAYISRINTDEISDWFNKIAVIFEWIKLQDNGKFVVFEFWATTGFTDDAIKLLAERKSKTKKYQIEFYGKNEIMEKAKNSKAKKITEIMREYFTK